LLKLKICFRPTESRAVILEQEFHSLLQGDLSVDAYAQQMKQTAHTLREVSHGISGPQLVLTLLRGLNPRFTNTADIIANSAVLPDFKAGTDMLRLKEIRLTNEGKVSSDTALAASTMSACSSSSCRSSSPAPNHGGGGGKGNGGRGGSGNGGGRNQQQQSAPSQAPRLHSPLAHGFASTRGPLPLGGDSKSSGARAWRPCSRLTRPSRRPRFPNL